MGFCTPKRTIMDLKKKKLLFDHPLLAMRSPFFSSSPQSGPSLPYNRPASLDYVSIGRTLALHRINKALFVCSIVLPFRSRSAILLFTTPFTLAAIARRCTSSLPSPLSPMRPLSRTWKRFIKISSLSIPPSFVNVAVRALIWRRMKLVTMTSC